MTRNEATKLLRDSLDANGLPDWKIRLYAETRKQFLGMCDYKNKTIVLNALHVDTHPDVEVRNTILHEVAHALLPNHGHDNVWADKARALGCDNTLPCASFNLDANAIDAIRSGASLEVNFTEETQVVRKVTYKTTKFVEKCPTCGKVAIEKSRKEVQTENFGRKIVITLECWHVIIKNADSQSRFEDLIFDGDPSCNHIWNKTICMQCGAKKLYPFQIEGARHLEKYNGKHAIFDEMGLGKTIQALAYLKFNPDAQPVLWLTKSGIKYQHAKEMFRILGFKGAPQVIINGKTKLYHGMNYVGSYDIIPKLDPQMFIDANIQTLVLDECQAIKNPDSSRTKAIRGIAHHIPRIIPLSGTPWKNRGSEFFVVLNMLDPIRFPSYKRFVDYHCRPYWNGNRFVEGGIANPKEFREKNSDLFTRRERIEVLPELPAVNRMKLMVEVPQHARQMYNAEEDKIRELLKDSILSGESVSFKDNASIMSSLIVMRQIVGIAKVPQTIEFAEEFLENTDRKLVIFVHHIKCGEMILEALEKFCKENDLAAPLKITSEMDPAARFEACEKFNGPYHRLLIASTLASGEGLNLQTCSDCIMHERQWNPANEEQAEGRFTRIGQTANSINATYVLGDDSVDTDLDGIVERKRIAFHQAMNKGEMPVWNDTDVINELVKNIMSKKRKSK